MSSSLKPWLVLGIIFIAGILTGSALTIGLASHFRHSPGAQQVKRLWMAQLVRRLNLTADQQAKIEPILADANTQIQSLHRAEMEHGSQIFKTANDQISALLTPDQKVELQKIESERKKRFSDHMRPWGPPPHGAPDDDGMPPPSNATTNAAR